MKYKNVLEMADKFAAMSSGTTYKIPDNEAFQEQRERLSKFYDHFTGHLRNIISEINQEIGVLKIRGFNPQMNKLFTKIHNELIVIFKTINAAHPYDAAKKLIDSVFNRNNLAVIDNLDFLAKHHLQQTNVNFETNQTLKHPDIRSMNDLKQLAYFLRDYIAKHPLIEPPSMATLYPKDKGPELKNISESPALLSGKEDKTKF